MGLISTLRGLLRHSKTHMGHSRARKCSENSCFARHTWGIVGHRRVDFCDIARHIWGIVERGGVVITLAAQDTHGA